MPDETLILNTLAGLLALCKEQQTKIDRLEIAFETLLDCPAVDWKETVAEVQKDLHEYDADSQTSSTLDALDLATNQVRAASSRVQG